MAGSVAGRGDSRRIDMTVPLPAHPGRACVRNDALRACPTGRGDGRKRKGSVLRAALWSLILSLGMLSSTYAAGARAADPGVPQPQQFSVYDGLPSNRVNAIAEDAQGYLWIATRDGLARYDGVGFRVWYAEDGLRDNFVTTAKPNHQ